MRMGTLLNVIIVGIGKASAMSSTEFMSNNQRSALQKENWGTHNVLPAVDVVAVQALTRRQI